MNYVDDLVKEKYEKFCNSNFLREKELKVDSVFEGYILPVNKYYNPNKSLCGTGGVVDSKYNYVESSAMLGYNMSNRLYGKYEFKKENIEYIDESVIYINFFIHHWGHFLIDVINRLWYILDKDVSNLKFAYIVRSNNDDIINNNYLELLELLGIKKENLYKINKVTKFREIIIPEASIYPGKYYTREYKKIFDRIVNNVELHDINPIKKVYCSRSQFQKSYDKEIGETKIEEIFNNNGFESIYMEKMTVREQIETINSSQVVVSISGTIPHNILFLRNPTKFIILNKTYKLNLHQFIINQIVDADVDFVDVNVSPLPVEYGRGPFIIKINKNIQSFFYDNNMTLNQIVSSKLSLKEIIWYYWRYLINNRLKIVKDKDYTYKEIRNNYKNSQK